jgi:D-glycero-D-manno-heptose 1,7-bisphosphate phosphatase
MRHNFKAMKRPAIFFDRDNTLIVSDGYLGDPGKVVLTNGAADAVARARSLGFATVVVSNQSGVARGMFSEDDVDAVNRRMEELLLQGNRSAVIDRHEFCPFHPEATVELYRQDSDQRKPKPGMILSAAQKLALDLPRSWVIGDAPRDIEAGKAAGCRAILLQSPELAPSPAASDDTSAAPDAVVTSLKDALDLVEREMNHRDDGDKPSPMRIAQTETRRAKPQAADTAPATQPPSSTRVEQLTEQILIELRKLTAQDHVTDFSVSKLLAGITQVVALAAAFLVYIYYREDTYFASLLMLLAIYLQVLTVALMVMGRQR